MTSYRIEGTALVVRNKWTLRSVHWDTYHPTRLWQRGQSPGAAGWVLKLPRGSLWLMLLGQRPSGWVHHKKETP